MLEMRNIVAGYRAAVVLRSVDLVVPDRSVVALLGANGAGKTTLLRVASGLLAPQSGDVLIDRAPVTNSSPHALAAQGVCHVPEGRGIWRSLSVRDHLALFARAGKGGQYVEQAVDAFPKLGNRLDQLAGTMSGGEQQMLALARAYVQNPRIVLLDEISMGLAPSIVDEIFLFIERLSQQGASLLIVEQYVQRALAIADYAYVLARGRVVFAGEPGELSDQHLFEQYMGSEVVGV
jgi:branched-chain amino acid transport system ATP-binding protein